jgi:hypothetical protein
VQYKSGGKVGKDGITVEASVLNNVYTENGIQVWYYEEPKYSSMSSQGTPMNIESPLFTKTDFIWDVNSMESIKKYGNITCRF